MTRRDKKRLKGTSVCSCKVYVTVTSLLAATKNYWTSNMQGLVSSRILKSRDEARCKISRISVNHHFKSAPECVVHYYCNLSVVLWIAELFFFFYLKQCTCHTGTRLVLYTIPHAYHILTTNILGDTSKCAHDPNQILSPFIPLFCCSLPPHSLLIFWWLK